MSSAAERIAAKAARLKQRHQEPAEAPRPAPAASTPRVKPVRSTVDLAPTHHVQLKAWCGETAVEVGRARVTTQDVMRALVIRLLTDEALARKVRADLRASQ
jgi:hypothetical protein